MPVSNSQILNYASQLLNAGKPLERAFNMLAGRFPQATDEQLGRSFEIATRSFSAAQEASANFRGSFNQLQGFGGQTGTIRVRFFVCGNGPNGTVRGSMDVLVNPGDSISSAYTYADNYLQGLKEQRQTLSGGKGGDECGPQDRIEPIMVVSESESWSAAKNTVEA